MANKETSKQWFKTGDYPTQAQFAQVFDWLRWKDDKINISDVDGLATALNNIVSVAAVKAMLRHEMIIETDDTYTVSAGDVIVGFVIESASDTTVRIGTSANGDDICEVDVTSGQRIAVAVIFAPAGNTQIFISGITATTKIIILKNPSF